MRTICIAIYRKLQNDALGQSRYSFLSGTQYCNTNAYHAEQIVRGKKKRKTTMSAFGQCLVCRRAFRSRWYNLQISVYLHVLILKLFAISTI